MAILQVEAGMCHGRGFSGQDAEGYLAKLVCFLMRPAANGSSQNFTADPATEVCTLASHGYTTGQVVRLTTTSALPAPLAVDTNYYIINLTANTFSLATTYHNAVDGTAIDITSAGTGTQSVYLYGGGANWYLFDDMSSVDPINFDYTDVDTGTEELTITAHGLNTGRRIVFSTSGTMPTGLTAGTTYYAIRVDANTIQVASSYYNAYIGTAINISAQGAGTHTMTPYDPSMVFCDTASPAANDIDTGPTGLPPRFIKLRMRTSTSGKVDVMFAMWHNTTTHFTYGYWSGYTINTYDDADFAYDFRAGEEVFGVASRLGTTWSVMFQDEFVGDSNLLEGTDKVGVLQSGVSAGSSVVLQLDTGEAANFTEGNYYYMFDFSSQERVRYVKVSSVNTGADQITLETLGRDFNAGSVIAAYAHRFYTLGTGIGNESEPNLNDDNSYDYPYSRIPYVSAIDDSSCFHNQYAYINGSVQPVIAGEYITTMNPNDKGQYAVQRPGICELTRNNTSTGNATGMTEGYGVTKNSYMGMKNSLARFLDGRVINSKNYLYIGDADYLWRNGSYIVGIFVPDTESLS